jgi:hypothetical protein
LADDLVALALRTIDGRARADVIAHVETCPLCMAELDALSGAADRLLELAPEEEPPLGFEVGVLARIGGAGRTRLAGWRRRTVVLVAAAALFAGVVGFLAGHGLGSSPPGRSETGLTAVLRADSHAVGELRVPPGRAPRLVVDIAGLVTSGPVTCRVTDSNGQTRTIGVYWLDHGSGTWTARLPFPAADLRSATITASNGAVLARASIS